jgi:hypothetical protein
MGRRTPPLGNTDASTALASALLLEKAACTPPYTAVSALAIWMACRTPPWRKQTESKGRRFDRGGERYRPRPHDMKLGRHIICAAEAPLGHCAGALGHTTGVCLVQ